MSSCNEARALKSFKSKTSLTFFECLSWEIILLEDARLSVDPELPLDIDGSGDSLENSCSIAAYVGSFESSGTAGEGNLINVTLSMRLNDSLRE